MPTLECSIHHFKGNEEKTNNWISRIKDISNKTLSLKEAREVKFGDFLYYDGSKITVINNNNYKYENGTN